MSAASDQNKILQYLSDRVASGNTRYSSIPSIRKNTGIESSNQYILTLMDELEMSGFVITRQAYRMSGGNIHQITGKGLDFVQGGSRISAESASWTGRIDVSEAKKVQIKKHLISMRAVIDEANLTNAERCNVLAIVGAVETLVEAPDPPWAEVLRLLRNPTFLSVVGLSSLLASILGLIVPATRIHP